VPPLPRKLESKEFAARPIGISPASGAMRIRDSDRENDAALPQRVVGKTRPRCPPDVREGNMDTLAIFDYYGAGNLHRGGKAI